MMKPKISSIEMLRGLSFLAIVMQHTLSAYIYNAHMNKITALGSAFILLLTRFAVPMFVFMTGLTLFYNYGNTTTNYQQFWQKRLDQVIWPYIAWSLFYFTWTSFIFGKEATDLSILLNEIKKLLLTGDGLYHLWFIVMIIQFYLLFPLFKVWLMKVRQYPLLTIGISLALYVAYLWFYQNKSGHIITSLSSPFWLCVMEHRDRLFTTWFFYFVLGGFAGIYLEQLQEFVKKIAKINFLFWGLLFFFIFRQIVLSGYLDIQGGYTIDYQLTLPLLPIMAFYIIPSMIALYYLTQNVFINWATAEKLLAILGRYSLGGYFIHAFILHYIHKIALLNLPSWNIMLLALISFIICSGLSLISCYFLNKIRIPLGTLLLGKIK